MNPPQALALALASLFAVACGPPERGDTDPLRTCPRTHAKVGWRLQLIERSHATRGVATLTDDCTVTLTQFSYDGGGIDVRVRGGIAPRWAAGFKMGPQLLGTVRNNDTLAVNLPAGKTLDDLDGISIWCETASTSFADGQFAAP